MGEAHSAQARAWLLHPSPGERSGSLPPSLSVDRAGQACRDLEPKLSKEYSTRPGTLAQVEAQQASNYPGALLPQGLLPSSGANEEIGEQWQRGRALGSDMFPEHLLCFRPQAWFSEHSGDPKQT